MEETGGARTPHADAELQHHWNKLPSGRNKLPSGRTTLNGGSSVRDGCKLYRRVRQRRDGKVDLYVKEQFECVKLLCVKVLVQYEGKDFQRKDNYAAEQVA